MNRRKLLGLGLATGAIGTVGGLGALSAIRPRKGLWPSVGRGERDRPAEEKHVVVVGGGLAGMSAAAVLASRGVRVTLLEAGDALGGKLSGWPIRALGQDVPMEHGFHGFFRQYYNLLAFLEEAGAAGDLVEQPSYTVLFADGREEPFGAGSAPFPLDLLEVLARSPSLSLSDVAGERPGMRALLSYDPVKTFAEWDGMDAEQFVRDGLLTGPFADLILRPFGSASMNPLKGFSAAELIRFFHFYMLGNPEGLGFSALGRGTHISLLGPIRRHLERLGVEIRTSTPVKRVLLDEGRARGVVIGAGRAEVVGLAASSVPAQGWVAHGEVFVRRRGEGFEARDARCTHQGCPVGLSPTGFVCPCHAGRYDLEGRPVSGPPPRPLQSLRVETDADELRVFLSDGGEEKIPADAVVVATEVRGLKAISDASGWSSSAPGLAGAAAAMGEADPYSVVRFWFDQPVNPERTAFYTVAGYPWTDGIATYSAFQEPYIRWAAQTGGSVVETHAYAIPDAQQGSVSDYRDALLGELRTAFPELSNARVLHEEAMAQSNFTRFAPGDFAKRSPVQTEIPNLFLAGDHVQLPFPAFLMEAAVASGRLAANHFLAAEGVREVPIPTVAQRGTLADLL